MQGKTHRVGGVLSALAGYVILEGNDMLIPNVEPVLQLAVMYPFAIYGSIISDLDHNWNSVPAKDPFSLCINKVLHLTTGLRQKNGKKLNPVLSVFDAKHRSWQTHSDLFLFVFIALSFFIGSSSIVDASSIIFKLIMLGFTLGLISHLILDSLTPEGIWFIVPSIIRRKKVSFRLVPKSKFFATGGSWERLIRSAMWLIIIFLSIYVIYTMSPYRISFNPL